MGSHERRTHSFIVRIWLEPRELPGAADEWRGEIRHVPGERVTYFRHLAAIPQRIQELIDGTGEG